jgi:Domain of unknown function (DUF4381)
MTAPLDKLHDFYQPPPPAWIPQTIGWYVLFVCAGVLILWIGMHLIRKWFANRYRRAALRELAFLPPDQFSGLLKQAALAAWPRDKVASLSGDAWLNFLSETAGNRDFHCAPGNRIEEVALRPTALPVEDEQELRRLAAEWIRRHRVQI